MYISLYEASYISHHKFLHQSHENCHRLISFPIENDRTRGRGAVSSEMIRAKDHST